MVMLITGVQQKLISQGNMLKDIGVIVMQIVQDQVCSMEISF